MPEDAGNGDTAPLNPEKAGLAIGEHLRADGTVCSGGPVNITGIDEGMFVGNCGTCGDGVVKISQNKWIPTFNLK